jgi:hypothetical protein
MSNESREGYAQRRADEVGRPYAVFVNPDAPQFDYAAFDCVDNRRVYAEIGATVVRTFNPAGGGRRERGRPSISGEAR